MKSKNLLTKTVADIYQWLDDQLGQDDKCQACGKCCDFESFGHKLFVTSPEMIYLASKLTEPLKPMIKEKCPYNQPNGKCQIYQYRFVGCRIFNCKTDTDLQNQLSEEAINKLKSICTNFQVPYRYRHLSDAFKNHAVNF